MLLRKRIGVFCGGSGSSKFVSTISRYADKTSSRILWRMSEIISGITGFTCARILILLTYSLSGVLDSTKGLREIADDAFLGKDTLCGRSVKETPEWFSLGDRDLGICLHNRAA